MDENGVRPLRWSLGKCRGRRLCLSCVLGLGYQVQKAQGDRGRFFALLVEAQTRPSRRTRFLREQGIDQSASTTASESEASHLAGAMCWDPVGMCCSDLHYILGGGCCERQNVCIFDISFLQKIPNPVLSRTKHCCFCNKSNHCAFSTALPMSFIDTLFQPKQTWIIDKNNKTNKCKCLSKECSIALKMYRLYISTGVSLNICNSSFGHVHSKQVPIYAICSL